MIGYEWFSGYTVCFFLWNFLKLQLSKFLVIGHGIFQPQSLWFHGDWTGYTHLKMVIQQSLYWTKMVIEQSLYHYPPLYHHYIMVDTLRSHLKCSLKIPELEVSLGKSSVTVSGGFANTPCWMAGEVRYFTWSKRETWSHPLMFW